MFFESCDILIKIEEVFNKNFDLRFVKYLDVLIYKKYIYIYIFKKYIIIMKYNNFYIKW